MRRPAGVIVAAILLGIIALFGILSEVFALGIVILSHSPVMPKIAGVRAMMIGITSLELAFFVFCAWTVVGLFRLRPWARIAAIVIAGLHAFFSTIMGFAVLLGRHYAAMLPPGPESGNVDTAMVVMALGFFLFSAISIWWLVYFNLGTVRRAFAGTKALTYEEGAAGTMETPAAPAAPSLSGWRIVIIVWACLMLLAALYLPWVLWLGMPMFFFGAVLSGAAGKAAFFVMWVVEIYLGIGLLRKWKPAWYVALLFQVYTICYSVGFLLPGVRARFAVYLQDFAARSSPGLDSQLPFMNTMLYFTFGFGLIVALVLTWALIARKADYLHG